MWVADETEQGKTDGGFLAWVAGLYSGRPSEAPDGIEASASGFEKQEAERQRAMALVGATVDDEVRVAYVDGRTFHVPRWCYWASRRGDGVVVQALIEVGDDRRPRFRHVEVIGDDGLDPAAMQRLPWRAIARDALAHNARSEGGGFRPGQILGDLERADKAESRRNAIPDRKRRKVVTDERLREVQALRAKYMADPDEPSWDEAAARETDFGPSYLRQLAHRADKELGRP